MAGYGVSLGLRGCNGKVSDGVGSVERVAAYIDGFNLYFGIRKEGRRYLWLDLEALARSLLKPRQQLVAVRYFTARVRNDPAAEQHQETYLKALEAHSGMLDIRQGRFQQKSKTCYSCRASWLEYEEKETDVSLAVSLLEDGVNGLYDTALLVSADSDMTPAVRALKRLAPGVAVVAAMPPNRNSAGLAAVCDAAMPIGIAKVRQAQLPKSVMDGPHPLTRPEHWK
jgi:uncharacterized LabA/DUF88 family protein